MAEVAEIVAEIVDGVTFTEEPPTLDNAPLLKIKSGSAPAFAFI